MILLGILLFLVCVILLLLFLNLHLVFIYDQAPRVTLRVLCFRFDVLRLFARISEEKKEKKEAESEAPKKKEKKTRGSLIGFAEFLIRIARVIALGVKEFFQKARIHLASLDVRIGTEDAAKTALLTSGAVQAAHALVVVLQRFSTFTWEDELTISPDFTSEKSSFSIHLVITTKPIHLIRLVFRSYMRIFERKEPRHVRNSTETSH